MIRDVPKGARAWHVIRRLYVLAVWVYALGASILTGAALLARPWGADIVLLTEAFAFGAGVLVVLYFLIFAWFMKRPGRNVYVGEALGERFTGGSGIEAFNRSLYAVIAIYGLLYVVVSLLFGEPR